MIQLLQESKYHYECCGKPARNPGARPWRRNVELPCRKVSGHREPCAGNEQDNVPGDAEFRSFFCWNRDPRKRDVKLRLAAEPEEWKTIRELFGAIEAEDGQGEPTNAPGKIKDDLVKEYYRKDIVREDSGGRNRAYPWDAAATTGWFLLQLLSALEEAEKH